MPRAETSGQVCSRCHGPSTWAGQRYCRACRNAYQREHRVPHRQLGKAAKRKANVRAKANVYQQRGHLVPQPCEVCGGTENVEKHHEDYGKPLEVRWLCRTHHRQVA